MHHFCEFFFCAQMQIGLKEGRQHRYGFVDVLRHTIKTHVVGTFDDVELLVLAGGALV
jgi:hypothetical protein